MTQTRNRRQIAITVVVIALTVGLVFVVRRDRGAEDPDTCFREGIDLLERGATTGISSRIRQLREHADWQDEALLLEAMSVLRGGKPDLALRMLAAMDQDGPHRYWILLTCGEAMYRLERFAEAERFLKAVVTEHPDDLAAHRWLGSVYYDLGANDAAFVEVDQVIRLDPSDFRPHYMKGIMLRDFELYVEAISSFEAALLLPHSFDDDRKIRLDLARARIGNRDYPAALEAIQKLTESDDVLAVRVICDWEAGQFERIGENLRRISDSRRQQPDLMRLEARFLEQHDQRDEAIRKLQDAALRFPRDAEIRYYLSLFLKAAGRTVEADEQSRAFEENQRMAVQLTELNLVAIRDPQDANVRDQLAKIMAERGDLKLAAVWKAAANSCRAAAARGASSK